MTATASTQAQKGNGRFSMATRRTASAVNVKRQSWSWSSSRFCSCPRDCTDYARLEWAKFGYGNGTSTGTRAAVGTENGLATPGMPLSLACTPALTIPATPIAAVAATGAKLSESLLGFVVQHAGPGNADFHLRSAVVQSQVTTHAYCAGPSSLPRRTNNNNKCSTERIRFYCRRSSVRSCATIRCCCPT